MNEANILCIKFDFGVPLEDIFPSNDIHPQLYKLFSQTVLAYQVSFLPLSGILKGPVSIKEVLDLKNALLKNNLHYYDDYDSSSFFWLLRHFLGLLPLPLFPKFTNGRVYNWKFLALKCKLKNFDIYTLEAEISWWIHKLPKANVMLIYSLIDFLRKICIKPYLSKRLDSDNLKIAVNYFISSLFSRPFRPGIVTKADKVYRPLLYFLVSKWCRIRRVKNYGFLEDLPSVCRWEETSQKRFYNLVKTKIMDNSCQTNSWLFLKHYEEEESKEDFYLQQDAVPQNEPLRQQIDEIIKEFDPVLASSPPFISDEEEQNKSNSVICFSLIEKTSGFAESTVCENSPKEIKHEVDEIEEEPIEQHEKEEDKKELQKTDNIDEIAHYEEVIDDTGSLNSTSVTVICKKDSEQSVTPKQIFKRKMLKANKSLINSFSKFNEKLKLKQAKSCTKLDRNKYNLLKNSSGTIIKARSLPADHSVTDPSKIRYKKLMTL